MSYTLNEIINDKWIIQELSSAEASQVGYYFAKYYLVSETLVDFFEYCKLNRYSIKMIDRKGDINYVDNKTNIIFKQSPVYLALNAELLDHFGPLQACYIGILSGIYEKKKLTREKYVMKNRLNQSIYIVK